MVQSVWHLTPFFTATDSRNRKFECVGRCRWLSRACGNSYSHFLAVMADLFGIFCAAEHITDFIEVNVNNLQRCRLLSLIGGPCGVSWLLWYAISATCWRYGAGLMTLPTIIIATRASIRAVPTSIRDAALGLGASPMQTALDHVLPLAAPNVLLAMSELRRRLVRPRR